MTSVGFEEAYREACRLLGEQAVRVSLLEQHLVATQQELASLLEQEPAEPEAGGGT